MGKPIVSLAMYVERHHVIALIAVLVIFHLGLPMNGPAQSIQQQDPFDQTCRGCWPNWVEVSKPVCGAQPRVMNGLGFLFVNGCNASPMLNSEHMIFANAPTPSPISEAYARFKLSNAANGGKFLMRNGGYRCLGSVDVSGYSSNELLVVTLRDDGHTWYGVFIGDYTLLKSDYVPNPNAHDSLGYSTIGLLRNSSNGIETLTMSVIPTIRRFINIDAGIEISPASESTDLITGSIAIQNGSAYTLTAEVDRALAPSGRQAGIIYLSGQGSPCTNLPQREVAVDQFEIRF
jgi:hypothetical protein